MAIHNFSPKPPDSPYTPSEISESDDDLNPDRIPDRFRQQKINVSRSLSAFTLLRAKARVERARALRIQSESSQVAEEMLLGQLEEEEEKGRALLRDTMNEVLCGNFRAGCVLQQTAHAVLLEVACLGLDSKESALFEARAAKKSKLPRLPTQEAVTMASMEEGQPLV